MPERHLHIVSFTVPFPANYGGVIDVFYKLQALKEAGVKVHLHCFRYDRSPATELEVFCESVHYYERKTGLRSALTLKPYIVASRRSDELLQNLASDDYPIIFEGLHSCYYLGHPALAGRKKFYRESNIEHQYYYHLFKAEKKLPKRLYFALASLKLAGYQHILKHADAFFVVSEADTGYLAKKFPANKVVYLPSFHGNSDLCSLKGKGTFALYHGNLSVTENSRAAEFLVKEVFNDIRIPFKIAGLNPPQSLQNLVDRSDHVSLIVNPTNERMSELIRNAHVNILVTFQSTGLKLKLLNTLYQGRFVLVNPQMLAGTGLEDACEIAGDAFSLKSSLLNLFNREFDESRIAARSALLLKRFSDKVNARKLINEIYG